MPIFYYLYHEEELANNSLWLNGCSVHNIQW